MKLIHTASWRLQTCFHYSEAYCGGCALVRVTWVSSPRTWRCWLRCRRKRREMTCSRRRADSPAPSATCSTPRNRAARCVTFPVTTLRFVSSLSPLQLPTFTHRKQSTSVWSAVAYQKKGVFWVCISKFWLNTPSAYACKRICIINVLARKYMQGICFVHLQSLIAALVTADKLTRVTKRQLLAFSVH